MEINYIIVQAGGKGTRLKKLTKNKPKALVPIDNLPMIFYLFQRYPKKRFIIIGDYKKDVLEKYLQAFATVSYLTVDAGGNEGTCAGLNKALGYVPDDKAFMIIWSDLILPDSFEFPEERDNWIGISKGFPCRWSFFDGKFEEKTSTEQGVAGVFIFKDKRKLIQLPGSGEFVKWLGNKTEEFGFKEFALYNTKEYGLEKDVSMPQKIRCRPFNRITVRQDRIVKEGIDRQGRELAVKEKNWYVYCQEIGYQPIPYIYSYDPLTMEYINGNNIFCLQLTLDDKKTILQNIINDLLALHAFKEGPADYFSIWKAYFQKTIDRLQKVRDLIPFSDKEKIIVNEKSCRNIFFHQSEFAEKIKNMQCGKFCLIHGDCTFSNILLREDFLPVFIDPRGYFGDTVLLGDPLYDWAKLYYSIRGNYDQFNLKRFDLDIETSKITLKIASNHWEEMEEVFLSYFNETDIKNIKLIHAIIWLSLTTYAWEDYDSICGAFYMGIYYLEEVL